MFNYELSYYIDKHRKTIAWTIGALFAVIAIGSITWSIYLAQQRVGKIAVPMKIVPRDAIVTTDTSTKLSGSTVYLTPGMHTISVAKDGFKTITKTYRIESYNAPAIYVGLAGVSDNAKKWEKNHGYRYQELNLLTAQQSTDYQVAFEQRNPIVKELPIKDPYFTISYKNTNDKSVSLIIRGTSPRYREFAINYLRQKGYEPTDYHIDFQGFHNPLQKDASA